MKSQKGEELIMIRKWEKENSNHPAFHVIIIETNADKPHNIQAYTDGSKSEAGVGAGIAIYQDNNLTSSLKYT